MRLPINQKLVLYAPRKALSNALILFAIVITQRRALTVTAKPKILFSRSALWISCGLALGNLHASDQSTLSFRATRCLSRSEAANAVNDIILPHNQYGNRISLGRQALGWKENTILMGNDPLLSETYGEFPMDGLDTLLDEVDDLLRERQTTSSNRFTVVDLGSGCGRLAIYMALSRTSWNVHGIEISPIFNGEATLAMDRALEEHFFESVDSIQDGSVLSRDTSTLCLHLGDAAEFTNVLGDADLIFCYSTAFNGSGFSEQAGAMILGAPWNDLLSQSCPMHALCITTDKALDPGYCWLILKRINVPNREVWESTAYIQGRDCGSRRDDTRS
jgi:hypothetical protein